MKDLLLAPNSLKECADSPEVSSLFRKYLSDSKFDIVEKPISDGGDGFLEICKSNYSTKTLSYQIINTYNNKLIKIPAEYSQEKSLLFIESAKILGLSMTPPQKRNPLKLNSRGLGDLLKKIRDDVSLKKIIINKVFIGIGGTATNDLGLGACSQFGLKIYDSKKKLNVVPENYFKVDRVEWEKTQMPFKIISIIDVNNKLLGKNGAAFKFAGQKGAKEKDLPLLENGFKNILRICKKNKLIDNTMNLSGAGGGLAAGLSIFFNAEIKTSKEFILYDLGIEKIKNNFDYVLTGEGSFDSQSLMDKGSGIILNTFKNSASKIFLCCGIIDPGVKKKLDKKVYCIEFSKYFPSIEESIKNYKKGIKLAAHEILKVVNS